MPETVKYAYSQELLDEISNPSSFHYDLVNEGGREEYANLFKKETIDRPFVNAYIYKVFKHKKDLKFAYHVTSMNTNQAGEPYLQTMIYYFRDRGAMLRFIQETEEETFLKMDRDNLTANTFIHLNPN